MVEKFIDEKSVTNKTNVRKGTNEPAKEKRDERARLHERGTNEPAYVEGTYEPAYMVKEHMSPSMRS